MLPDCPFLAPFPDSLPSHFSLKKRPQPARPPHNAFGLPVSRKEIAPDDHSSIVDPCSATAALSHPGGWAARVWPCRPLAVHTPYLVRPSSSPARPQRRHIRGSENRQSRATSYTNPDTVDLIASHVRFGRPPYPVPLGNLTYRPCPQVNQRHLGLTKALCYTPRPLDSSPFVRQRSTPYSNGYNSRR